MRASKRRLYAPQSASRVVRALALRLTHRSAQLQHAARLMESKVVEHEASIELLLQRRGISDSGMNKAAWTRQLDPSSGRYGGSVCVYYVCDRLILCVSG